MWLSIFISLVCVLMPSVYAQNLSNKCTGITTTRYGPLKPPECGLSNVTLRGRIVGGQPATLGAWPWMAALGYRSGDEEKPNWQCGGCLISEQHVLTAAHCVYGFFFTLYLVRIGDLDLDDENDGAQPFQDYIDLQKSLSHPDYNSQDKNRPNDIAVVKTYKKVPFSSILHPICLPVDSINRKLDGLYASVAGWGRTSYGGPTSRWLLQTQVPITTQEKCQAAYRESIIDHTKLCAGQGGKDTCQYDSGGPLMISGANNQKVYYVVGITSWGYGCGEPTHPGVYTKVTAFLDYITQSLT